MEIDSGISSNVFTSFLLVILCRFIYSLVQTAALPFSNHWGFYRRHRWRPVRNIQLNGSLPVKPPKITDLSALRDVQSNLCSRFTPLSCSLKCSILFWAFLFCKIRSIQATLIVGLTFVPLLLYQSFFFFIPLTSKIPTQVSLVSM